MRFATCGNESKIIVWTLNISNSNTDVSKGKLAQESLEGHSDFVRDVSWLNFPGSSSDIIASCSDDQKVLLWKKTNEGWKPTDLPLNNDKQVCKVSWSQCGTYLAVTTINDITYLYKVIKIHYIRKISTMNGN